MVVNTVKRAKSKNSNQKLPPGPWKLPVIGNMHQLAGSLPHHSLRNLAKKYGPLMHLQLGEVSTIVVSSPEMAEEVMKSHDVIFAQRPSVLSSKILSYDCKGIAFGRHGNYWRQLRKILMMELLSASRGQSYRSLREEDVSNLIKTISLCKGSTVNLSEKISSFTYGFTSTVAFGKKSKDQEAFISIIEEVAALISGFNIADFYPSIEMLELITGFRPKLEKLHQRIDRILEIIVNEHKERRRTKKTGNTAEEEDIVDVFLRLQEQGDLEFPLTDNNIKAVIFEIFSAGSETSSTTVDWALSEMLKNPRVMKKAQSEVRQVFGGKGVDERGLSALKYLRSVIKETLRLHPPVPLLVPRECSETCEIYGYTIPVKTRVIVNAWAIGRDHRYWNEAEKFYPERFLDSSIDFKGADFGYIPFGAGRRICPGISFALPNIELPLAQLLYHFDWKLPNGMTNENLVMTEAFGFAVRRKEDLILIPIPYNPLSLE